MSEVEEPLPVSVAPQDPPKMVAVRRRRGRRRTTEPAVKRKTLNILLVVFAVAFIVAAVPMVRQPLLHYVRQLASASRPPVEVLALGFAGLVLIYLLPGVEDKVLIALGIRKRRRTRNSHR
jgi:hypothetical protein